MTAVTTTVFKTARRFRTPVNRAWVEGLVTRNSSPPLELPRLVEHEQVERGIHPRQSPHSSFRPLQRNTPRQPPSTHTECRPLPSFSQPKFLFVTQAALLFCVMIWSWQGVCTSRRKRAAFRSQSLDLVLRLQWSEQFEQARLVASKSNDTELEAGVLFGSRSPFLPNIFHCSRSSTLLPP